MLKILKNKIIKTLVLTIFMIFFTIPTYATSTPDIPSVSYKKLNDKTFEAKFTCDTPNVTFYVKKDIFGIRDTSTTSYQPISGDTYRVTKTILDKVKDIKVKACIGQKCSAEIVLDEFNHLNRQNTINSRLPNAWQELMSEYRVILAGISGLGLLTAILTFIINMVKLGYAPNHQKVRREFMMNIIASLVTTALLGATTLILTIFYSVIFL